MKRFHFGAALAGLAASLIVSATAQTAVSPAHASMAKVSTAQFYQADPTHQYWNDAAYNDLITALKSLSDHGLNPADYSITKLEAVAGDKAARDQLATAAWLTAAAHMLYGKVDPVSVEPDWTVAGRKANLPEALKTVLRTGAVVKSFDAFIPAQPIYTAMQKELAALRQQSVSAGPAIPDGPSLKPGMTGERVKALQAKLIQLGLLEASGLTSSFDPATKTAVETFQTRNDLDNDGVVGPATLRALNKGLSDKINQLVVNMERWRWLPNELGQRHLRANIAGFEVTAYENGLPVRTHLTIVGKTYRKTPVFSDEIEYIVFNPWWETPPSLARADKLPMFKKDPGAVSRLGFQVLDSAGTVVNPTSINWNDYSAANFPYRLRQAPGEQNALGKVKIMFPNPHNVYLHDTPTRGLFAQRQRAFSSGCLRTQDPVELSKWLLEKTLGWDSARVYTVVASGAETRATLAAKVPVHILYQTVINDGLGGVRYLDDIYDRDMRVLKALQAN